MRKILILLMALSAGLWAGEERVRPSQTDVEESGLFRTIQLEVISLQANSEEILLKREALSGIDRMIDEDLSSEDVEVLASILWDLGLKGTGIVVTNDGTYIKNLEEIREESARLLGDLGREPSARVLTQMLRSEYSIYVLAQAARSAAAVIPTLDPDSDLLEEMDKLLVQELANTMKEQNTRHEIGHFALSFLDAVAFVMEYDHTLVHNSDLIEQLLIIADNTSGYNRVVRDRAWEVIGDIQNL